MLVKHTELITAGDRIGNCRVQALCDLLRVKGALLSPYALFLCCFNTLLSFSAVSVNHMVLPMVSSFHDNLEELFLTEQQLNYRIQTFLKTASQLKEILDTGDAFIVLCDANSALRRKKNKSPFQVGVCSGITLLGYHWNDFIYSQPGKKNCFSKISSKMLEYSRNFQVYPSAPQSISIHILEGNDLAAFSERLYSPEYLKQQLDRMLIRSVNPDAKEESTYLTNQNFHAYLNQEAVGQFMQYLEQLYDLVDGLGTTNKEITTKVIELKLKMLRKALISGTSTFNRAELAESIRYLGRVSRSERIDQLAEKFEESGKHFRQISKFLYQPQKGLNEDAQKLLTDTIEMFQQAFQFECEAIDAYLG